MNSQGKVKRNSSIELLKIIAIIGIILSHAIPYDDHNTLSTAVINLECATSDLQTLVAFLLHNLGQIGNDIFLICSAWFLCDSKNVKPQKAVTIILDMFIVSVLFAGVFLAMGYRFESAYLIKLFMPFTYSNNWFLTNYVILYLIHPLLNYAADAIGKKGLLAVNVLFIVLYVIRDSIDVNTLFEYNSLIGFVGVYFMTVYCKRYLADFFESKKNCIALLLSGIVLWLLLTLTLDFAGLKIGYFSDKLWQLNTFKNPAFLLLSFGVFGIAKGKTYYNKGINYLSSLSLFVYIIHANRIINDYLRYDIFSFIEKNYSFDNLIIWIIIYAAVLCLFGFIAGALYKETLHRLTSAISQKLYEVGEKHIKVKE